MISGLQIINHRERTSPLALTLIFYILSFYLFLKIPAYRIIHGFMVGCVSGLFATLLISFRWKISLHMTGLGGLTAFLLMLSMLRGVDLLFFLLITIFASGLAGTSRLYLDAHTPEQIYTGFFLGFGFMSLSMVIL
jgi:membrane-associated phospholipid phosphatase